MCKKKKKRLLGEVIQVWAQSIAFNDTFCWNQRIASSLRMRCLKPMRPLFLFLSAMLKPGLPRTCTSTMSIKSFILMLNLLISEKPLNTKTQAWTKRILEQALDGLLLSCCSQENMLKQKFMHWRVSALNSPHRSPSHKCQCWDHIWYPDQCAPGCQSQSFHCPRSCSSLTRTRAPGYRWLTASVHHLLSQAGVSNPC